MRKFQYRTPRLPIHLLVELTMGSLMQHGSCNEISTEGMRVELGQPFAIGMSGTVRLSFENLSLVVPVSVVRSGAQCNGLRFDFATKEQREVIGRLVSRLASPQACTSLVLCNSDAKPRLPALLSAY